MPKVSLEKKARISALLSAGLSTVEISIKEKVSRSTVARIKKRESIKMSIKDIPRSGRPRSFSVRGERKVARLISSGKYGTAKINC